MAVPAAVATLLIPFLLPATVEYSAGDWNMTRAVQTVTWEEPLVLRDRPSPEGDYFTLSGHAALAGRQAQVSANGARTMVFSYHLYDPLPADDPAAPALQFEAAGFTLAPARCPLGQGAYPDARRWYRIDYPGKRTAHLYTDTGSDGADYALYIGGLPAMDEPDALRLTDDCATGTGPPTGYRTGTEAVVSLIDTLMRPVSAPASVPWATVESLPSTRWQASPMRMSSPYTSGGSDTNPYTLGGMLITPTTQSEALATGSADAATRFYFRYLNHVRAGAVFDALRRKGYRITAVRCGKPYTRMSENWFAIEAPGRQPAILYRGISLEGDPPLMSYMLRLDNLMPPLEAGQRAAPAEGCPG